MDKTDLGDHGYFKLRLSKTEGFIKAKASYKEGLQSRFKPKKIECFIKSFI